MQGRFYRLTIYNLLSNLTVPLVGLVDTAMLGRLPDITPLGGVALASILFDFLYYGFGFLRMGTTGLTSRAAGRGDTREIFIVFYRGMIAALVLGAIVLVLQTVIRDLGLGLSAGSPEVKARGAEYFNMRVWAAPAVLLQMVLMGWLIGRERAGVVLALAVIANVSNLGLDYLFILRMGEGAAGAGKATMLAQYISLIFGAAYFLYSGWERVDLRRILERRGLTELARLNRDIFLRTLALIASFAVFVNASAFLGNLILVVNSILQKIITTAAYMIDGFAIAVETMAGRFYSQGRLDRVHALVRLALGNALAFACVFALVIFAVPETVLGLLTTHRDVTESGMRYLPWVLPYLLFAAGAWVFDGLFIGLTFGREIRNSMVLAFFVFLLVTIPGVYLRNNDLLWLALSVLGAMRLVTLWLVYRRKLAGTVFASLT